MILGTQDISRYMDTGRRDKERREEDVITEYVGL